MLSYFNFILVYILFCQGNADTGCLPTVIKTFPFKLEDNGYVDMLIAIDENIKEDEQFLENLENAFISASDFLYKLTEEKVYFKRINILTPPNWTLSGKSPRNAREETFQRAAFQINDMNPGNYSASDVNACTAELLLIDDTSKTRCGMPQARVSLDVDLINQEHESISKIIIHEFLHLRYGVFDENWGTDGDVQSTCSVGMRNDGFKNKYLAEESASIMSSRNDIIPAKMCEDGGTDDYLKHNVNAMNKQNDLCDGRSVKTVVMEHADFKNDFKKDVVIKSTIPTFNYMKSSLTSVILVLDKSSSMAGSRLDLVKKGATYFIEDVLADNIRVSIVTFESSAQVTLRNAVTNSNKWQRENLARHLPVKAGGGTTITAGVNTGMSLARELGSTHGVHMILVCDGDVGGVTDYYIRDIVDNGVIIHTIAISDQASDTLNLFGQRTGGGNYFVPDSDTGPAVKEAFRSIGAKLGAAPLTKQEVTLYAKSVRVPSGDTVEGRVTVDDKLGNETKLIIDYSDELENVFWSCNNTNITRSSTSDRDLPSNVNVEKKTMTINLGDNRNGTLCYGFKSHAYQTVSVAVTSKQRDSELPIIARPMWTHQIVEIKRDTPVTQKLLVFLTQGYRPVTGAIVNATVMSKNGKETIIYPEDSGIDSDEEKDDGIYSANFVDFDESETYDVSVEVSGNEFTAVNTRGIVGKRPSNGNSAGVKPTGKFQRFVKGETFQRINTFIAKDDIKYKPSKVKDFSVIFTPSATKDRIVEFLWTAVGNKLMNGKAKEYIIEYTDSNPLEKRTRWRNITSDMLVDNVEPLDAGNSMKTRIDLTNTEGIDFWFRIRAVGDHGPGEVSNKVRVRYGHCNPACVNGVCITDLSLCQCHAGWTGDDCNSHITTVTLAIPFTVDLEYSHGNNSYCEPLLQIFDEAVLAIDTDEPLSFLTGRCKLRSGNAEVTANYSRSLNPSEQALISVEVGAILKDKGLQLPDGRVFNSSEQPSLILSSSDGTLEEIEVENGCSLLNKMGTCGADGDCFMRGNEPVCSAASMSIKLLGNKPVMFIILVLILYNYVT